MDGDGESVTDPNPVRQRESSGSGLTAKLGPLPVWGWVAIFAVGGAVVMLWMNNRKAAATSSTDTTSSDTTAQSADISDLQSQLATVEAQIRDTQGLPATPGPPGPQGAQGPPGTTTTTPPPPGPATQYATALKGYHVDEWITDLGKYGFVPGFTWEKLLAFNPSIGANINWHTNSALNTFKETKTYRVA